MLKNKLPSAMNKKHSGMTVIELVVAMSIATLIVTGMLAVITHIFTTRTNATRQMMAVKETQDVIDSVTRDLRFTERFLTTPQLSDPYESEAPAPGTWNFEGTGSTNQLILEANATTDDYRNPDNRLLFEYSPTCSSLQDYVMTNIVYYVSDDNTLYRRTIMPESIASCPTEPFQNQTCQDPSTAGADCNSSDIRIADNVSEFSIEYHSLPYSPDEVYIPDGSPDSLTSATTIRLNITINDESSRLIEPSSASILLSKGAI